MTSQATVSAVRAVPLVKRLVTAMMMVIVVVVVLVVTEPTGGDSG